MVCELTGLQGHGWESLESLCDYHHWPIDVDDVLPIELLGIKLQDSSLWFYLCSRAYIVTE